jgi:hypothetical protein
MSRPILANTPWWSSQFKRLYLSSPLPPRNVAGAECLYVSRHACSRTTIKRRVSSRSVFVRGGLGATGMRVGLRGGEEGAARLRDSADLAEGTNEGERTERAGEEPDGGAARDMVRGRVLRTRRRMKKTQRQAEDERDRA